MPPARGRGRGRGRQAKAATPKKAAAVKVAENKEESLTEEPTGEAANQDTIDIKKNAEEETNKEEMKVATDTPEETTEKATRLVKDPDEKTIKEENTVIIVTPEETAKAATGFVKDPDEKTIKEENTDSDEKTIKEENTDPDEKTMKEENTVILETPEETAPEVSDIVNDPDEETSKEETIMANPEETTEEVTFLVKDYSDEDSAAVTMETPEETTKEVTDLVMDPKEDSTKEETIMTMDTPEETGDVDDVSEERSMDEIGEITQERQDEEPNEEIEAVKESTEEGTEDITEDADATGANKSLNDNDIEENFEDIVEDIDISGEMTEFDEETAEISNIDDEEANVAIESEISAELGGGDVEMKSEEEAVDEGKTDSKTMTPAAKKKDFKIEITKKSNLKPLNEDLIRFMTRFGRDYDWKCQYHRMKLSKISTRKFVERLSNLEKKAVTFVTWKHSNHIAPFAKTFMSFDTNEQRVKSALVFEPLIKKTSAKLGLRSHIYPSSEMVMKAAHGDNCLHLNNVPENTTSKQLKAIFPQADEVSIPVAESGKSLGYAILYFKSKVDAETVQKFNKEVMIGNSVLSLQKMYISNTSRSDIPKGVPEAKTSGKKKEKIIPHSPAKQVKHNPVTETVPKQKNISGNAPGNKVVQGKPTVPAKGGPSKQSGAGPKSVPKKQPGTGGKSDLQKQTAPGKKTGPQKQPAPGTKAGPQKQSAAGIKGGPQKYTIPKFSGGQQKQSGPIQQRGQQQKGQGPKGGPLGKMGARQGSYPQMQQKRPQGGQQSQMDRNQPNWQRQASSSGASKPFGFAPRSSGPMENFVRGGREQFSSMRGDKYQTGSLNSNSDQVRKLMANIKDRFPSTRSDDHPPYHRERQMSGGDRGYDDKNVRDWRPPATIGSSRARPGGDIYGSANRDRNHSGWQEGASSSRQSYVRDHAVGAARLERVAPRLERPAPRTERIAPRPERPVKVAVDRGDIDKLQGIMKQQLNKMKQQMEQTLKKQLKDQLKEQLKDELREIRAAGNKRKQQELAYQAMSQKAVKRQRIAEQSYHTEDIEEDAYPRRLAVNVSPRSPATRGPRLYDRSPSPENAQLDRAFQKLSGYGAPTRRPRSPSPEDVHGQLDRAFQKVSGYGAPTRRPRSPSPENVHGQLDRAFQKVSGFVSPTRRPRMHDRSPSPEYMQLEPAGYDSPPRRMESSFDQDIGAGIPMQVFNYNNKSMTSTSAAVKKPGRFESRSSIQFVEDVRYPIAGATRRSLSPSGIQITRQFDDYVSPLNRSRNRPPTLTDDYYSDYMGSHTGGYN